MRHPRRIAGVSLVALAATGAIGTAPAAAQTTKQTADGDIIVTAQRIEERLQDVPISITVFNQQQITERNLVNAQDLAIYTPSLTANTNFGSENTSYAIRGFVQDAVTAPSVGVYFAEVVAPRGASPGVKVGDGAGPGNFFDLQNVQVLKGPQGTLFGRNTTGGAILFVPQKPTGRLEGFIEGSLGNYGMKRLQGALNLPIAEFARFRFAFDDQKRDGFLKNDSAIGPRRFSDTNYTALRASLVLDLASDIENYTIGSYLKSNTNGFLQKLIACNPGTSFGAGFACPQLAQAAQRGNGFYAVQNNAADASSRLEQWQVINTTTLRVADSLTVKNIVSYAELRQKLVVPLFGVDWMVAGQPLPFANIRSAPGQNSAGQTTFTEEFQIQGSMLDQRLTFQTGVYYEKSTPIGTTGTQTPTLISCQNIEQLQCTDYLGIGASQATGFTRAINVGTVGRTLQRTTFRNVGLYAQASYAIDDHLKLTGGLRYTWDRQRVSTMRTTFIFPVLPPFTGAPRVICTDAFTTPSCSAQVSQRSGKPTWLIDLDYKPSDDILVYGKYVHGYRAGGVAANAPSNYRTFSPEKVNTYEGGLKASFGGAMRGRLDFAAFYNDFSNQQLQVGFSPAPGRAASSTSGIVNAGRSRIYGVEVETSISPFTGLRLEASYAYLHARIRSIIPLVSVDPNYILGAQISPGDELVLSPRNKYTITANYTLPLDEAIGRITVGATFAHIDRQQTNYAYPMAATVAAFGADYSHIRQINLLNLNTSWSGVAGFPIDVSAFATNVTKRHYYSFIPGLASVGFESAILGEPRMYGVRLRYRFGER